ncbi:MAG: hypothetical protein LJE69_13195, partial [Thiohalocapsa sp.]|uniref:hypothetical protein n=1 Tax=Thiohalocapsa sp. TaxID=2497641 RepID=UPI0025DE18F2
MSVITDVRISSLWLLFWLLSGAVWASGLRFEDAEPIPLFDNPFSIDKQESDYYLKFELFEGEGVTVALTAHVNSGSMSFYAYQPDDQNNSFASATYIGNGETKTASFTAKVGGTYWVKVTGSVGTADVAVYRAFFNAGVTDASRSFYST